jgi:hypothetical protein
MDDEAATAHRRYYVWWRVYRWSTPTQRGVKLGPLTLQVYKATDKDGRAAGPWFVFVSFLGRPLVDSYLRQLRRRR